MKLVRAGIERALARILGRHDADGDVARRQVVLEPIHHPPAVHVGQHDVERDGVGHVVARQRQGAGALRGHQALAALFAHRFEQQAREGHVVLDDEQHGVAGLDRVAIVLRLVGEQGRLGRSPTSASAAGLMLPAGALSAVPPSSSRSAGCARRDVHARDGREGHAADRG